ncbi:hypothetical protein ACVW19_006726 [Streptomyces sp. TE5632]
MPVSMMLPPNVRRSTMAAQRRGTVHRAYDLLRTFGHEGHPTPLGQAFAEYGRTMHLLALVDPVDETYRRLMNRQLPGQESRHRPARASGPGVRAGGRTSARRSSPEPASTSTGRPSGTRRSPASTRSRSCPRRQLCRRPEADHQSSPVRMRPRSSLSEAPIMVWRPLGFWRNFCEVDRRSGSPTVARPEPRRSAAWPESKRRRSRFAPQKLSQSLRSSGTGRGSGSAATSARSRNGSSRARSAESNSNPARSGSKTDS